MWRFAQVGIALGALGVMLCFMGLFPGVTGAPPTPGIGIVQVIMVLFGYALLVFGALIYGKFTFYLSVPSSLVQQIGIRLSLTGILFAALAGLADILGFGSHVRNEIIDIFFGEWQMVGILASFALSSIGVLIYVVAGLKEARLAPTESNEDLAVENKVQESTVAIAEPVSEPVEASSITPS